MNESQGYAVFFFPQALEALGDAIKPYLLEGAAGAHVLCKEIDTSGSLIEMTLNGQTQGGKEIEIELIVPSGMVRMIVSAHSDDGFGFGPRIAEPRMELPVLGPTAVTENASMENALAGTATSSAMPTGKNAVVEPKPS